MSKELLNDNLSGDFGDYKSETFSLHKLRGYLIPLYKYWWVILPFLAAAIGKEAYNVQKAPITYISNAEMKVGSKVNIPDSNLVNEEYRNFYKTQTHIMQSAEVKERAFKRLTNMYPDYASSNQAVSIYASQIEGTSIFRIQAVGAEPLYTQRFLDACIDEYLQIRREEKEQVKQVTYIQMESQLNQLGEEIVKKEDELQEFQSNHDIVSIEEQARSAAKFLVFKEGELAELENELDLINLYTDEARVSESLDFQYMSKGTIGQGEAIRRDSDAMQTKQKIRSLEAEMARFSKVLRPAHPKIKGIKSTIESLQVILTVYQKQGKEEITNRKKSIQLQITSLKKSIAQWKEQSLDFSRKLAGFQNINSRLTRLKDLYAQKLAILDKIDLSGIEQDVVSIIKRATPATANEVTLVSRLPKACILGLALGLACIAIITLWKETIYTENNLPITKDYKVAGYIPKISGRKLELLKPDDTRYSFIESFRSLRSYILLETQDGTSEHSGCLKIISVTSAIPSEGKSTVSSNLAISLSIAGYKTLLIDADMRKGQQHVEFKTNAIPGLSEVLSANASIDEAIVPTKYDHLDLMPRGEAIMTSSELILGSSCKQFFDIISQHYRYIVVDTPPILATDDMANLIPYVDKILLVARLSLSQKKSVEQALNMLEARNGNIMGYVLNSCESSTTNYYNYRYYGKYYATPSSSAS